MQQQTTPISPPSMMPNAFIPDQPSNRSSASAPSFQGSPALPRTLSAARGTQMLSTASHRSPETYSSRDARTGFLGPTSYSAVYTENSGKQITPLISHSLYPRATNSSIICHCHFSNVHHKQRILKPPCLPSNYLRRTSSLTVIFIIYSKPQCPRARRLRTR